MRPVVRLGLSLAAALLVGLPAGLAGVLAYPQPLFDYDAALGRLELWSDNAFSQRSAERLLGEVERRLARSPLNDALTHRIFVVNAEWRARLLFLWSYGAGGLNYEPLTRNVFIRRADIERGVVFGPSGRPVEPPRDLAYYATHEIGHSLVSARIGAVANWELPRWVREGVPDYVALAGQIDIAELARQLRRGEPELDPARSGRYDRFRLLVAYAVERQGFDLDGLLRHSPDEASLERAIRAEGP